MFIFAGTNGFIMTVEKTAPALIKIYNSGDAELTRVWVRELREGKGVILRIPESVQGLSIGDYFSIFEVGKDKYRMCKVQIESLPCAKFLKLHSVYRLHGGSFVDIEQDAEKVGIEPSAQIMMAKTPQNAYRVDIIKSKLAQDASDNFITKIEVQSGGRRGMKVPFSAPSFVATYITSEGKLLMKHVEQPNCTGTLLGTVKVFPNTPKEGRKVARVVTLPASLAYLGGRYVTIKGGMDMLQMEAVPDDLVCEPVYTFKKASRIFTNGRGSGILTFIPNETVEKSLEKGPWIKQHANIEGQIELEKLHIKPILRTEVVRISKLFKIFDDVTFIIPVKAVKALKVKKGDFLSVYDNHGMLELTKESTENSTFLGVSEVKFYEHSIRMSLPKSAEEIGFDETTYVIVRLSENKILLENAIAETNSSVSKLFINESYKAECKPYVLEISSRLRGKVAEGNYALIFEKRQ